MRASRSGRSRQLLAVGSALLVAAVGSACGGGSDDPLPGGTAPGCEPMPAEPVVLEGDAAMFDLAGVAEPIRYQLDGSYLTIVGRAEPPISDRTIDFIDVVQRAGFDVAGTDDEGFEAEVFFARGLVGAGMVVLTESACPGKVDVRISVLDDPAVLPSDSSTAPPG